jgi:hypothetical protein
MLCTPILFVLQDFVAVNVFFTPRVCTYFSIDISFSAVSIEFHKTIFLYFFSHIYSPPHFLPVLLFLLDSLIVRKQFKESSI